MGTSTSVINNKSNRNSALRKIFSPIILWLKLVVFDAGYNGRLAVLEVVGGKDAADAMLEMVQTITCHLGLD